MYHTGALRVNDIMNGVASQENFESSDKPKLVDLLTGKASLENFKREEADGSAVAEIERVFYARISDWEQLSTAKSRVYQEQWQCKIPKSDKNAGQGNLRVRKIAAVDDIDSDKAQYVFALKMKAGQTGSNVEVEEETTKDMFLLMQYLADQGMIKDRYTFEIENSECVWEVDLFRKPDGSYHEWCKIDLEGWKEKDLPAFPIQFEEIISGTNGETDDAKKERITEMYSTMFLSDNIHLKQAEEPPSEGTENTDPENGDESHKDGTSSSNEETQSTQ